MKNTATNKTKLFIKNMVCRHCIEAVLNVLKAMNIEIDAIRLGEVELNAAAKEIDFDQLKKQLEAAGFELLEDKEKQIVEKIKAVVIRMVYHDGNHKSLKKSIYIAQELGYAYAYLSKLFSRQEHLTIEKYIILQKIERAKELLSYGELSLSEIAYDLSYKSVQHLSNQFKSITGMSVRQFKQIEDKERKSVSEV